METRITELIGALRDSGSPAETDLAGRLWRCWKQRDERRDGVRDRVDRPCRSVACEYCRRWLGQQWRERAAKQMQHADNAHSSLVTIMLTRVGDLSEVRNVVREFRIALRNLRDRRAREDARWRKLEQVGLAELDVLAPEDIAALPPSRRDVIGALPVRSHGGGDVTFVIHVHLAVSHPLLPRHAVERIFGELWEGAGRVHVCPFRAEATAAENAGRIVEYASKHKPSIQFEGGIEMAVPVQWQARYWGWLHGLGCGLAPLRVRMSAMRDTKAGQQPRRARAWTLDVEPMPVLVGP